ncbi:MAG: cupin domain-containing protein [bacterium]|nr:cupin domain-containing protein [bacterium]
MVRDLVLRIGEKIRRFRQDQNLSIQKLAEISGVSPAGIYKIETDGMIPSVATMIRIAHALGRKVGEFLDEAVEEVRDFELVRRKDRTALYSNESRMVAETIAWRLKDWKIFAAVLILEPGGKTGDENLYHEGEELILCLRGRIEINLGEEKYLLRKGDSFHYKSSQPHSWRNPGKEKAEMVYVLTPPLFHHEVSFAEDLKKLSDK